MTKYFLGACAFSEGEDVHLGCHELGEYALGWGGYGSIKGLSNEEIAEKVRRVDKKKRPQKVVRMLARMRDMRPGYQICLRHRNKNTGSVVVGVGTITSGYFYSSRGIDKYYDGHLCQHRVKVDWEWFEPGSRPAIPETLWNDIFHQRSGSRMYMAESIVELSLEQWNQLMKVAGLESKKEESNPNQPSPTRGTSHFGGGGETEKTKRLKRFMFIMKYPEKIGVKNCLKDECCEEHGFVCPDRADLLIVRRDDPKWHVVEIKENVSDEEAVWGIHQAVKYRVLRCMQLGLGVEDKSVVSHVVFGTQPPAHVRALAEKYSVKLHFIPCPPEDEEE